MIDTPSRIVQLAATSLILFYLLVPALDAQERSDETSAQLRWLLERQPGLDVQSQHTSRIDALIELHLAGDQIVYLSRDGKTAMIGQMIDLTTGQNLTEKSQNGLRQQLLSRSMPDGLFEFPADKETDRITVVTDIDCTYCRRLHTEVDQLNSRGISVQYLMLPRSGNPSASWDKAVWAACADNPEQALTDAMNGQAGSPKTCDNNIVDQAGLAASLRLNATPAIIFESGQMINSYLTPDQISAQILSQSEQAGSD